MFCVYFAPTKLVYLLTSPFFARPTERIRMIW